MFCGPHHSIFKTAGLLSIPILVLALATNTATAAVAADLTGLQGSWGGQGAATFDGGSKESMRCNGYYKGEGDALSMVIKCASAGGAKIELRGQLTGKDGAVTGTWEERTYNATGSVKGSSEPGALKVSIDGAISGTMSLSFTEKSQTVTISTTGGSLRTVNISFNRDRD
jgi:hypothetical protein